MAHTAADVHTPSPMPSKQTLLFRIGTLALLRCAVLNAQVGMVHKLPVPRSHPGPTCNNCVRDLSGQISSNPAPVREFRNTHPCPANGSLKGPCPGYVVDRKKPLHRGGRDTPDNMRWRTLVEVAKQHVK
jgi:hypothetical protein